MTILQIYNIYINNRSSYCSTETIRKYRDDLKIFFRFLERHYKISVDKQGFHVLEQAPIYLDFIVDLRSTGIRDSSVRSYCRSCKAFLRFCYDNDFCIDYLKNVKMPKDDSAMQLPLYVDEVKRIDALFDRKTVLGIRNYCIFHLMLDCGLRRQEVIHLRVEHLDAGRNILHIVNSKGGKSRFVLIPDFLISAISEYHKMLGVKNGVMFYSLRGKGPLTTEAVRMMFQNLKTSAELPRLHAHLLRHTFAASYLIGGGNLEFLRVFMGHYDYASTKTYVSMAAQLKILGAPVYELDSIFFKFGY